MMRSAVFMVMFSVAAATAAGAQDGKKGEQVYVDQKCSLCHAIAGKGNVKGPLDGVATKLKAEEMRQWITDSKAMTEKTKAERKPPMKVYSLAADEVDALIAYLSTLKKK